MRRGEPEFQIRNFATTSCRTDKTNLVVLSIQVGTISSAKKDSIHNMKSPRVNQMDFAAWDQLAECGSRSGGLYSLFGRFWFTLKLVRVVGTFWIDLWPPDRYWRRTVPRSEVDAFAPLKGCPWYMTLAYWSSSSNLLRNIPRSSLFWGSES